MTQPASPGAHTELPGTCPACGAQLGPWVEPAGRPWYRRFSVWIAATVIGTVVLTSAFLAVTLSDEPAGPARLTPADRTALAEWWSGAYPAVHDLDTGVNDTTRAMQQLDATVVASAW